MVKDIRLGGDGSGSSFLTDVNGTLFFFADDGIHGWEIRKSDGTDEDAVIVKDIRPGSDGSTLSPFAPNRPVNVNGILFFYADDVTHGAELWKSGRNKLYS